ncbi:hypothetical protein [Cetobacterium sp.]
MKRNLSRVKKLLKSLLNVEKYIEETVKFELLKQDYDKCLLNNIEKNILNYEENKESQIIVSLTTYSKRIYSVYLTIESLFRQTLKPNKIILWLAEDEYKNIPCLLKILQDKGLEIRFCKDIKSYKKLIPTLKKYPNDIIITVDDDIIYPIDFIENLYKEYLDDQNCIYYYIGHKIKIENNKIMPYSSWEFDYQGEEKTYLTLPTGVGGVLYPPNIFSPEVFNEELFIKLAPNADDLWFKAMTLKNGIKCKKIKINEEFYKKFIQIKSGQDIALYLKNLVQNENDRQLKNIFDYYGLWDDLKESD